jgi:Cobalamin synthesis protein cobW C-terminal domain
MIIIIITIMNNTIVAVAGPPGSGKTSWIRQDALTRSAESFLYFCPGTESVPIDATYLATEHSGVQILTTPGRQQLHQSLSGSAPIYLEIGFHLQLSSLEELLQDLPCERIAIVPPGSQQTDWQAWASQTAIGAASYLHLNSDQLWRSPLTGQVLDPASLSTLWYELSQGAYGTVQRAKGIFDLADGKALHCSFVAGLSPPDSTELNLPRWQQGRPDRFSGLEVIGTHLDQEALAQALTDCCLDDPTIAYYQQQLQNISTSGASNP